MKKIVEKLWKIWIRFDGEIYVSTWLDYGAGSLVKLFMWHPAWMSLWRYFIVVTNIYN